MIVRQSVMDFDFNTSVFAEYIAAGFDGYSVIQLYFFFSRHGEVTLNCPLFDGNQNETTLNGHWRNERGFLIISDSKLM